MLFGIVVFVFVIVCILLCLLVLIQSDKGGGISGAIGGGLAGASSMFGTQDTANILTRGTMIFGGGFFILCIIMSFVMSKQTVTVEKTLLQKRAEKQQTFSPSSVLDRGGLPIRQSQATEGTPGAANAVPTAGLPITKSEPEPAASQPVPAGAKTLPVGSIPVGPPAKK